MSVHLTSHSIFSFILKALKTRKSAEDGKKVFGPSFGCASSRKLVEIRNNIQDNVGITNAKTRFIKLEIENADVRRFNSAMRC